jgi:hypothetical protein
MRVASLALSAAAVLLLWSLPAQTHHSFAGTYDADKQLTIKGKMAQFSLRSPHSFFYVEVEGEGKVQRWVIEGGAPAQFAQQGSNKDSLKVGDVVEVLINPSRSANATRGRLLKIVRTSDGKTWGGGGE